MDKKDFQMGIYDFNTDFKKEVIFYMSTTYKSKQNLKVETTQPNRTFESKSSIDNLTQCQKQLILKLGIRLIIVLSSVLLTFLFTNKKGYILINSMLGLIFCEIVIIVIFQIAKAIGLAFAAIVSAFLFAIFIPLIVLTKSQPKLPLVPPSQQKPDLKTFIRYFGELVLRLICLEFPTFFLLYFGNNRILVLIVVFFGILLGEIVAKTIKIQFNSEVTQILQKKNQKLTMQIQQKQQ